ncbi:MAG TPA: ABC transporter permease [Candidatus Acidoferrales bacterium]|nr:ABC transporter permease [Candidatus Acidoferrales bacterium]
MAEFLRELKIAMRALRKAPGFAAIAVTTLGLGVGANTAVFSAINAVLLRPLPYNNPDRLVAVWASQLNASGPSKLFDSYLDFETWRSNSKSFETLAAASWARAGETLILGGAAQRVTAIQVSGNFFELLGAHAELGRTFAPEDMNSGCAVVMSHGSWETIFGSKPDIVGSSITLDAQSCSVVGVMPRDFEFYPKQTSLWTLVTASSPAAVNPINSITGVFGRLKSGVTSAAAQDELTAIHRQTASQGPAGNWLLGYVPRVYPLQGEFTWLAGRNLRQSLLIVFAAVCLVLLIACVNVANLILARGVERRKELAVRLALGSGGWRLARQVFAENLLIGFSGGALGAVFAFAAVRAFRGANPIELPPGNPIGIDWRVLVFSALAALVTIFLSSAIPTRKLLRFDVNTALKEGARSVSGGVRRAHVSEWLVMAEVALSLLLLAAAGLLIQSIARLDAEPLGFRTDHMLTASVNLPAQRYSRPDQSAQFFENLTDRLSRNSEVSGVAVSSGSALYSAGSLLLTVEGNPAPPPTQIVGDVEEASVSKDYLRVMEVPLLAGRAFDLRDGQSQPAAAIINEALAKEYFPAENPLGRRIRIGGADSREPWLTIVGECGDMKRTIVYKEMGYIEPPIVLRAMAQAANAQMTIFLRTRTAPDAAVQNLRRAVSALDPVVPVTDVRSMDTVVSEYLAHPRFRADLLAGFAALAVLLAAIGIYGVMSQSVGLRTQEMGIRMALGAHRTAVLRLVLARAAKLALFGATIGVAAALAAGRTISSLLYDVSPNDPIILGLGVLLVVAIALLASYVPARRATHVDPIIALRSE